MLLLIGIQTPVVEEATVEGGEEDAAVLDVGGVCGDGEGSEFCRGGEKLLGERHSHCHVATRW